MQSGLFVLLAVLLFLFGDFFFDKINIISVINIAYLRIAGFGSKLLNY